MKEKSEVNDKVFQDDKTQIDELSTIEIIERTKRRVDDVGHEVGLIFQGW